MRTETDYSKEIIMDTAFGLNQERDPKGSITNWWTAFAVSILLILTFWLAILSESSSAEDVLGHVAVASSQSNTVPNNQGIDNSRLMLFDSSPLNGPLK